MNFQKWIARRLAVGGTARVIAKQYKWLRKNKYKPTASDKLIFNELIMFRFKFPHTRELIKMVDEGQIKGLKHLVIEFLSIEADFKKNTIQTQNMFAEIIEEELRKKNIPTEVIN